MLPVHAGISSVHLVLPVCSGEYLFSRIRHFRARDQVASRAKLGTECPVQVELDSYIFPCVPVTQLSYCFALACPCCTRMMYTNVRRQLMSIFSFSEFNVYVFVHGNFTINTKSTRYERFVNLYIDVCVYMMSIEHTCRINVFVQDRAFRTREGA